MLCVHPPSPSSSLSRRGVPGARVVPGYALETSRRAWWRGLFALGSGPDRDDVDFEGEDAQLSRSAGGSVEEGAAQAEAQLSSPSSAVGRKRPRTASTTLPPTASSVSQPSDHLKWARHVSKVQGQWHRQQRWLNNRGSSAPRGPKRGVWLSANTEVVRSVDEHTPGSVNKMVPPDRSWIQALRTEEGMEPPPSDWQEKKFARLRRERALQRLHLTQRIWRQDQARKVELSKYEGSLDIPEVTEQPSGQEWDWPAGEAIPVEPAQPVETEVDAGSDELKRSASRDSFSEDSLSEAASAEGSTTEAFDKAPEKSLETAPETATDKVSDEAPAEVGESSPRQNQEDQSPTSMGRRNSRDRRGSREGQRFEGLKRELSLDVLEEWRTDFPLEVLDSVTDFYESIPFGADGTKVVLVSQLQEVAASVFGFPPQVVLDEIATSSLPRVRRYSTDHNKQRRPSLMVPGQTSPADSRGIAFSNLVQFLDFFRNGLEAMEKEHTELLWSQNDLKHIGDVFSNYANSSNCIPMSSLFEAIQKLGFEDLRVGELDQQRWLADVIREILQGRRASSNTGGVGTLTLPYFTRIVTFALRAKEKAARLEEFTRERQVRKLAGISPVEMEELRELHRDYVNLEVPVRGVDAENTDPLARMTLLLHRAGLGNLSERDASALQRIVRKLTPPDDMERFDGDTAPFDVFILWMREVFTQSIGNLEWRGTVSGMSPKSQGAKFLPTSEELEGKKGFTTGMLREALRRNVLNSSGHCWAVGDGELGSAVRRNSSDGFSEGLPGRSRLMSAEAPETKHSSDKSPLAESWQPLQSFGDIGTSQARHGSAERQRTSHANGRWSLKGIRRSSGQTSRPTSSAQASRTSSRSNSRRGSGSGNDGTHGRKGSLPSVAGGGGLQDDAFRSRPRSSGAAGMSVLHSQGLPSSESMLGRKLFRANSVELQDNSIKAHDSTRRSHLATLPQLNSESVDQGTRKMKPVQDSLDIVNSTITKLSAEQEGTNNEC